jgi:CDGSH-type Zn-finger protein
MADTEKLASPVKISIMEEKKMNNTRVIVEDIITGPLIISGNILVKDVKTGTEKLHTEVWLCRCGKSENKPYCDRSHKKT